MNEANREEKHCPHMLSCPMYKLLTYAGTLATWKIRYCQGPYTTCARYKLSVVGNPVPINLMPNGALLNRTDPSK